MERIFLLFSPFSFPVEKKIFSPLFLMTKDSIHLAITNGSPDGVSWDFEETNKKEMKTQQQTEHMSCSF